MAVAAVGVAAAVAQPNTERVQVSTGALDVTVTAGALRRAAQAVTPARGTLKKRPSEVTMGIRLVADGETLTANATNGDVWASCVAEGALTEAIGSAVLPLGPLHSVLDVGVRTILRIVQHSDHLGEYPVTAVHHGAFVTRLTNLSAGTWPEPPTVEGESWSLDPSALASVLPACDRTGNRPIVAAVMLSPGAMAATDSYRLHAVRSGLLEWPSALVPAPALRWVTKLREPATITYVPVGPWEDGREYARIEGGGQTWTVLLTKGEAVNWRPLFPASTPTTVTADRAEMLDALAHVLRVEPTLSLQASVRFDFTGGALRLRRTVANCESEAPVAVQVEGDLPPLIAFNGIYLRECIRAGSGPQVRLNLVNAVKPVTITDESQCERLLMPVRMQ